MTSPYTALTPGEQNAHITMASTVGYSGIYPSGTAHFFDPQQSALDNHDLTNSSNASIFEFTNLNSRFSNATESYIIDDFTIFNSYIHNDPNPQGGQGITEKTPYSFTINTSQFLNTASAAFNIYSLRYRG